MNSRVPFLPRKPPILPLLVILSLFGLAIVGFVKYPYEILLGVAVLVIGIYLLAILNETEANIKKARHWRKTE